MIVFAEHEIKKYRGYFITLLLGCIIALVCKYNIYLSLGYAFVVHTCFSVVTDVFGRLLARILFTEVTPKSVRELKHSEKQYQYILKLPKREVYSYVYTKPLSSVNVKCWTYLGSYMIEVTSKKGVKRSEEMVT